MRTLHVGIGVSDRERSLRYYERLGYEVVGTVPGTGFGDLTMLKLPADEFVTLELVSDPPAERGTGPGLHHLVVQVESLQAAVADLAARGIEADHVAAATDADEPSTAWVTDPDGNRIELVQWPVGHPAGLSAADWDGAR